MYWSTILYVGRRTRRGRSCLLFLWQIWKDQGQQESQISCPRNISPKTERGLIVDDAKRRKLTPPSIPLLSFGLVRTYSHSPSDFQAGFSKSQKGVLTSAGGNTISMAPFYETVKGVFGGALRPAHSSLLGKAWTTFDASIQVRGFEV